MSRRRGPRGLSPEEAELWEKIAARTRPLKREPSVAPPVRKPAPKPAPRRDPIAEFQIGSKTTAASPAHDLAPTLSERIAAKPVAMDSKAHRKLTRGKLKPEARIDLHGMTQASAHPALIRFISESYDEGRRLVLVITGKGRHGDDTGPIPVRTGVLRHQVPQWLSSGALRPMVMQVTEAHQRHGGSGALYVYLRRSRQST